MRFMSVSMVGGEFLHAGLSIDQFSALSRVGGDFGQNDLCVTFNGAPPAFSVDGEIKVYPSKKDVFIILGQDAILSFPWGEGRKFIHNKPLDDPLISDSPIEREPALVDEPANPVMEWLLNGERGASSEAMCFRLHGKCIGKNSTRSFTEYPFDPSDFTRCRLLVEETGCRDRIGEMSKVSPIWALYAQHWDELCEIMDSEVGWMKGDRTGSASQTYAAMKALQYIAEGKGEEKLLDIAGYTGWRDNRSKGKDGNNKKLFDSRMLLAKYLIRYGVDIDSRDKNGKTPLFIAVENLRAHLALPDSKQQSYYEDTIRALVGLGANKYIKASNGESPASLAQHSFMSSVLCKILDVNPDPELLEPARKSRMRG